MADKNTSNFFDFKAIFDPFFEKLTECEFDYQHIEDSPNFEKTVKIKKSNLLDYFVKI